MNEAIYIIAVVVLGIIVFRLILFRLHIKRQQIPDPVDIGPVGEKELNYFSGNMTQLQKSKFLLRYEREKKDRKIAIFLSIFLGWFGIDRFYLKDIKGGIFKLFSFGGLNIGNFFDMVLIKYEVDEYNHQKAQEIAWEVVNS